MGSWLPIMHYVLRNFIIYSDNWLMAMDYGWALIVKLRCNGNRDINCAIRLPISLLRTSYFIGGGFCFVYRIRRGAAYKYFCACAVISNPFNRYDGFLLRGKPTVVYALSPGITMRLAIPAYSYRHGLNFILGIVKTRIGCSSGITYPSLIVMGPGAPKSARSISSSESAFYPHRSANQQISRSAFYPCPKLSYSRIVG